MWYERMCFRVLWAVLVNMYARVCFGVTLTGVFLPDGILCNTHIAFLNPHTQHLPLSDCTLTHQKSLQKDPKLIYMTASKLTDTYTGIKWGLFALVSRFL